MLEDADARPTMNAERPGTCAPARARSAQAGGIDAALAKRRPAEARRHHAVGRRWCSACSSRACANISRSSATARPSSATCCASTRRKASPAPSTAATRWRWRMPRPRCAGSTARSRRSSPRSGRARMQAFAGSLAAASNGVGVYHIYGDETTFGEGYNMQQVPKEEQGLFGQMTAIMGRSYVLHTPEALRDALRRGALTVNHPYRAGPFYLLLPLNTQPAAADAQSRGAAGAADAARAGAGRRCGDREAAELIAHATAARDQGRRRHARPRRRDPPARRSRRRRGGALARLDRRAAGRACAEHACRRLEGLDQRQLRHGRGRSADRDRLARGVPGRLLRHRLQDARKPSSTSTAISPTPPTTTARSRSSATSRRGRRAPGRASSKPIKANASKRDWLAACAAKKAEWARLQARALRAPRRSTTRSWQRPALAQPAAIKIVADFAKEIGAAKFFDAGDVQANGFQIVEDDRTGDTFTETGASYMGFAASALLASALADKPRYGIAFCGDGSFMMNPQILIDGVEHGVRGMIVIFDNRRMAAITGLQVAQYGTRSSAPTTASPSTTCGSPARSSGVLARARRLDARTSSSARSKPRTRTTACRSCTCRSIAGRTNSAGSAPGANGTSATGATTCSAPGSSRIYRGFLFH